MQRAATEVMQSVILSAVIDALEAMKAASGGVPNNMLRDLQSVHRNTTFADLPKEVQASITASVRSAFTRLLKEGYSVSTGQPAAPRGAPPSRESPRRDGPRHDRGPRPPHPNRGPGGRPAGGRPPPKGVGPRRGPKPGGK